MARHEDKEGVELLRRGAPLLGILPQSGNGTPEIYQQHESIDELRATAGQRNRTLLARLKEGEHSCALMDLTKADVALGRMEPPVPAEQCDLEQILISQRFPVVQGKRDDGSLKIRPVDDCTASGLNPCTQV